MQTPCQYFLEMQMLGFIFTARAAAVFMTLNTAYEDSPVLGKRTREGWEKCEKAQVRANQFYLPLLSVEFLCSLLHVFVFVYCECELVYSCKSM